MLVAAQKTSFNVKQLPGGFFGKLLVCLLFKDSNVSVQCGSFQSSFGCFCCKPMLSKHSHNFKLKQECEMPACGGLRSKGFKKLIFSLYSIILKEVK